MRDVKPGGVRWGVRHPRHDLWISLALLVAVLAVYSQVRTHDFLNYDDPEYVTDNAHVRDGLTLDGLVWAFTSGHASNWIPLTWLSHMLDCQLFGLDSGPQHLVNVVLHAFSTLLLFGLLKRITGARWRSAFVAFVFALHPLHVESVAWIAERKDVLCALFWFLTLWAYVNYTQRRSAGRYLLVVLLFCCGLMSKPMIVTLPFVALLLDVWPLRRIGFGSEATRKGWARLILEKLPLMALSAGASVVTYLVQQSGGSVSAADQIPLLLRVENALVSYVVYLGSFVWPAELAVFYPYPTDPQGWAALAAGLALAALTVLALRWIGPRPYLAVGWLWYLGTLVPVIGLVQVGVQSRADRYTYVPMIGISIVVAWGAAEVFERRRWGKTPLAVLGTVVCASWAAVTWRDLGYWQNSVSLFRHALEVTDGNYIAYNNLGVALREDGRIGDAIMPFEEAVTLRPQAPDIQDNLGEALLASGRIDEAIPHLSEAVRLRPDFAKAHVDLGSAMIQSGRAGEAEAQYRRALQLQPESAEAHYGLGGVLMREGRIQEALPHLQAGLPYLMDVVRTKPGYADGHYNLGTLFALLGRTDEAIAQFSETVRLQPDLPEARVNLGIALAGRGRLNEALDEFSTAIRLRPDYANAHFQLGKVLATLGRYDEAVREFTEVLRLRPDFAEARRSLEESIALRNKSRR